jgi:hypothetical protein
MTYILTTTTTTTTTTDDEYNQSSTQRQRHIMLVHHAIAFICGYFCLIYEVRNAFNVIVFDEMNGSVNFFKVWTKYPTSQSHLPFSFFIDMLFIDAAILCW